MSNLISTFQERFGDWLTLGQHLQLSLLTLIIAIFLSIPLAIYLSTREVRVTGSCNSLVSFKPSLPWLLLGLFIPIMGIGTLPALTALVIYAIFPILQNTITGLRGLDPSLEEAGIAFWDDQVGATQEVRDSLGYACGDVRGKDFCGNDYRDCDLGSLDWSRGTRFL